MKAAQAGDMRAYERLLKEITPELRQIVRRRRQFFTAEEVEDLVQETLLSVHAVRATFDPRRPLMPWLFTIAHNRLVDSARRYYRGKANEVKVDELPVTFADDRANTENEGYRDPEELTIAIRSLPDGQRKAIETLKLREMSLKEAAATSGVRQNLSRRQAHPPYDTLAAQHCNLRPSGDVKALIARVIRSGSYEPPPN